MENQSNTTPDEKSNPPGEPTKKVETQLKAIEQGKVEQLEVKPKIHHGHPYREDCPCAKCRSVRDKIAREKKIGDDAIAEYLKKNPVTVEKQKVIDEFVSSLEPQNKMIVSMSEETKKAFIQIIVKTKDQYTGAITLENLNEIVNKAIQTYETTIK